MSNLVRACLLGLALIGSGCGGTSEIGPAKDTKQEDEAGMKKVREESMNRNRGGESPEGEQKTP